MSHKCPTNLVCTCYIGDDQNECRDMPCYACVLEAKEKAQAELEDALDCLESMKAMREKAEAERDKWQKIADTIDRENDTLEEENSTLEAERDGYKRDANEFDQQADALYEKCKELREVLRKIDRKLSGISSLATHEVIDMIRDALAGGGDPLACKTCGERVQPDGTQCGCSERERE